MDLSRDSILAQRHRNALTARRIHPELPLPSEPVVTPSGKIKWVAYSARSGGTMIEVRRGRLVLAGEYQDEGYVLLSKLFEDEGWDEGMAAYREYMEASARGEKMGEYPDRLLPREVLARRSGTSKAGRQIYVPREVKRPGNDEVDIEVKKKPRKRAQTQ